MNSSHPTALSRGRFRSVPLLLCVLGAALAVVIAMGLTRPATAAAAEPLVDAPGTPVVGWVRADGPVVGAQVQIRNVQGRVLGRAVTNATGMWAIRVDEPRMPKHFEVRAVRGTDHQGPVRDALVADIHGYVAGMPITVNVATTLVDHYEDQHPRVSIAKAEHVVARALGLPRARHIGFHTHYTSSHYSDDRHAEIAHKAGGINEYLRRHVVRKVHTGQPHKVREPLRRGQVSAKGITVIGVGKFIGKNAAGAVVGKLADLGFSALLEALGMPDPTAESLARIEAKLEQISKQLDAISERMTEVSLSVDEVNRKLVLTDYENSVAGFTNLSIAVPTAFRNLQAIAHAETPDEYVIAQEHFLDAVEFGPRDPWTPTRVTMFRDGLAAVDAAMVGAEGVASSRGALRRWTDKVSEGRRYWTADGQQELGAAWQHWANLQSQLLVVNLAYHQIVGFRTDDKEPLPERVPTGWKRDWGSVESTKYVGWAKKAGIHVMRPIAADMIYDDATQMVMTTRYRDRDRAWGGVMGLTSEIRDAQTNWWLPNVSELNSFTRSGGNGYPNPSRWGTPSQSIPAQGGPDGIWGGDFWMNQGHHQNSETSFDIWPWNHSGNRILHNVTVELTGSHYNGGYQAVSCTQHCVDRYNSGWYFSKENFSYQANTAFWPSESYPNARALFIANKLEGKAIDPKDFTPSFG